jgi:hypothetical protein
MITNRDTLIAAMAGGITVPFAQYAPNAPGSGSGYATSGWVLGGRKGDTPELGNPVHCTNTTPGALPIPAATTGNSWYVGALSWHASNTNAFHLYDRLAHARVDSTLTTAQSIGLTRPARSTTAHGVYAWLEVHNPAPTGVSVPAITVSYTNSDGVAGRTGLLGAQGTFTYNLNANNPGFSVPMTMQGGDRGVASVQTLTISTTALATTPGLVLYLARTLSTFNNGLQSGFGVQLGFYDLGGIALGTNPCLSFNANASSTSIMHASARMIQG